MPVLTGSPQPVTLGTGYTLRAPGILGAAELKIPRPAGSALFLEDGTPLLSTMFRAARYGGDRQPLLFLNGCMSASAVIYWRYGRLSRKLTSGWFRGRDWSVVGDRRYGRARHCVGILGTDPTVGPTQGKPVGEVLRDLRAKYMSNAASAPVSTYLAYVYYGHPRLVLQRAAN